MTRIAETLAAFRGASILDQFMRALLSLVMTFRDRQEVKNLAELDERMLKDIGLTRDDVASALAQPIHHRPSWVLVRCVRHASQAPRPAAHKVRPVVPLVRRA